MGATKCQTGCQTGNTARRTTDRKPAESDRREGNEAAESTDNDGTVPEPCYNSS